MSIQERAETIASGLYQLAADAGRLAGQCQAEGRTASNEQDYRRMEIWADMIRDIDDARVKLRKAADLTDLL